MKEKEFYVAGADFGSDSVRVVILDASNGKVAGTSVSYYKRWAEGLYCDGSKNQFRQHPNDYKESLTEAFNKAIEEGLSYDKDLNKKVVALSIDTTGSTVALTDEDGFVLAENEEFSENADAMFLLWKDHTSVKEAAKINDVAKSWGGIDYTMYSGGVYSSEWYWAKILHVVNENKEVKNAAVSAVEHCDWIVATLTGTLSLDKIKRSRCASGHKCLWHEKWGGYPSDDFLNLLDPKLSKIKNTLGTETYTTDVVAGTITEEWKKNFNLESDMIVTVGAYDAHIGAVGGDIRENYMVKSIGTSTCDIIISKTDTAEPVKGICGQVDGSVVKGYIGYEAGQSAYGDLYAWFRKVLLWPLQYAESANPEWVEKNEKTIIRNLEKEAENVKTTKNSPVALDWINGRRTPNANQNLRSAITGLSLGTSAPEIMKALLEATAYGARAIIECFEDGGVKIDKIIAIGGVARKSILGMQILSDVTQREIHVTAGDQSPAIGAAIFAATAAGLYKDVFEAQEVLSAGIERVHMPSKDMKEIYDTLYEKYTKLGQFEEEVICLKH